jgi:hypothetical protein
MIGGGVIPVVIQGHFWDWLGSLLPVLHELYALVSPAEVPTATKWACFDIIGLSFG